MSIIFGVEGVTREIHCHEAGTSVTRLSHGWVIKEILGHKIYTSDHKRDTVMHRVIKEIPRVIIEIPRVIIEIPPDSLILAGHKRDTRVIRETRWPKLLSLRSAGLAGSGQP